jgi:hypothetical protein
MIVEDAEVVMRRRVGVMMSLMRHADGEMNGR